MPRVRYTGGATYRIRDGPEFGPGDEADVNEGAAERLTARPDFERVADPDNEDADDVEETDGGDEDSETDIDALTEKHWQTVVSEIESGAVDEHLGELEDDDRESVQDAVAERRAELEG